MNDRENDGMPARPANIDLSVMVERALNALEGYFAAAASEHTPAALLHSQAAVAAEAVAEIRTRWPEMIVGWRSATGREAGLREGVQ